ncbi:mechanosensitive ion channel domain-containing protein [Nannocystaceae bacterium ST9]
MIEAAEAVDAATALVGSEFAPRWSLIALALVAALALGMLSVRAGAAPTLRRGQRWFHALSVLTWTIGAWLAGLRLLEAPTLAETAARALLLLVLIIVPLPILRDVFSGLAIAIEGRHRIGDDVRVDAHEGRIVGFGLRSVILRDRDGTETTLPYRRFAAHEIVRLNLASRDAPCQFEVAVPPDFDLDAGTRRLLEAAMLSPYAAPGRRPEVFAVADASGGMRLRVRAYVFDRAYEERYRGDVLARAELVGARPKIELVR